MCHEQECNGNLRCNDASQSKKIFVHPSTLIRYEDLERWKDNIEADCRLQIGVWAGQRPTQGTCTCERGCGSTSRLSPSAQDAAPTPKKRCMCIPRHTRDPKKGIHESYCPLGSLL